MTKRNKRANAERTDEQILEAIRTLVQQIKAQNTQILILSAVQEAHDRLNGKSF